MLIIVTSFGSPKVSLWCNSHQTYFDKSRTKKKKDYSTVIMGMLLVYCSTHKKQLGGRTCKQAGLPWIHSSCAYLSREVWLCIKATIFFTAWYPLQPSRSSSEHKTDLTPIGEQAKYNSINYKQCSSFGWLQFDIFSKWHIKLHCVFKTTSFPFWLHIHKVHLLRSTSLIHDVL